MVGEAGDRHSTLGGTGRRPGVPRTPASRRRLPGYACTRASTPGQHATLAGNREWGCAEAPPITGLEV